MPTPHSPIFVLGTQRSGSTLLTRILSMHSQMFIQNEMTMWGIFIPPFDHDILLGRIIKQMRERYRVDMDSMFENGVKWGWKDPLLTHHLPHLKAHFSNSKYLLLIRDPRAVVASYIDNRWGLGTNAYTGALRWKDEVEQQLAFANEPNIDCFIIKYEDLLAEPESHLTEVCQFLDVPFEQSMLDYHKKPLEFAENRSNVNTQQPLDASKIGKWQARFSDKEIGLINTVCKPLMDKLGYQDKTELQTEPSTLSRQYYLWHQKIIGEIQLQYQLKKVRLKRKFG